MCRQISAALLCMCSAFPAKKGEQMILTSFSDVITILLVHKWGVYKVSAQEPQGCHLGFSKLNILVTSNKATDAL